MWYIATVLSRYTNLDTSEFTYVISSVTIQALNEDEAYERANADVEQPQTIQNTYGTQMQILIIGIINLVNLPEVLLDGEEISYFENSHLKSFDINALIFKKKYLENDMLSIYNEYYPLVREAMMKEATGDIEGALLVCEQLINLNKLTYIAYYIKGRILNLLYKFEDAILNYNKAIQIKPDYLPALIDRGAIYSKLGDLEKALKDYDSVLNIDPSNSAALNNRGNLYLKMKMYDLAIADLTKSIATSRHLSEIGDAEIYFNRALVYKEMREYEKAFQDFAASVELDPQNIDTYYNEGILYIVIGKNDEAIANLRKVMTLEPDSELADLAEKEINKLILN